MASSFMLLLTSSGRESSDSLGCLAERRRPVDPVPVEMMIPELFMVPKSSLLTLRLY